MPRLSGLLTALFICSVCLGATTAEAGFNYSTVGYTYQQSFDSLSNSGTNSWTNDSTLADWSLFNSTGAAISAYNAGPGNSNAGSFYSFGATNSSERALGGVGSSGTYFGSPSSGSIAGWIAVAFTNNTGLTLTDFTLRYDGEQWRNGGNTNGQTMVLEYGFGGSFGTVPSWTAPGSGFNFTSLVVGSTPAAVDGNDDDAGLTTGIGGAISGLLWANGDTLWIRWVERNDAGNDHGLAIDNFSFSAQATATPEASSLVTHAVLISMAGIFFGSQRLLRRKLA